MPHRLEVGLNAGESTFFDQESKSSNFLVASKILAGKFGFEDFRRLWEPTVNARFNYL